MQSMAEYSCSLRPSEAVIKESSESLSRQATRTSLSLRPSPRSFARTRPLRCVLPLPFIVVAIVVERINIVAECLHVVTERQSRARIAVVIFVCACDVHSSSLNFSKLVAGIN